MQYARSVYLQEHHTKESDFLVDCLFVGAHYMEQTRIERFYTGGRLEWIQGMSCLCLLRERYWRLIVNAGMFRAVWLPRKPLCLT